MTATSQLLEALRKRYIKRADFPGGLFVPEVGQNGGGNQQRCDAIYIGFTSASGRLMVGHELKVSRSDWLHELKQIDKADRWADACHEWWLVVVDRDIVKDGELPAGWGLLAPGRGGALTVVTHASRKLDFSPPWWAVRSVMARSDTLVTADLGRQQRDAQEKGRQQAEEEIERRVQARLTRGDAAAEGIAVVAALRDHLGLHVRNPDHFSWSDTATTLDVEQLEALRDLIKLFGSVDQARKYIAMNLGHLERELSNRLDETRRLRTELVEPLTQAISTYDHV